jgi:dihydroneopterin aldolase
MNQLKGIVGFEKLKICCIIGVEPHERNCEQEIYVDLKVKTDLLQAATSDDLNFAIDYTALACLCERVAQNHYFLLETYAIHVLNEILERFTIEWAWICVRKPSAIVTAACSLVEIKKYKV